MAVDNLPESDIERLIQGDAKLKFDFFTFLDNVLEQLNRNEVQFGTGSPETVVKANKGAKYLDTAAAAGSNYYIKTTDNINTGWQLT